MNQSLYSSSSTLIHSRAIKRQKISLVLITLREMRDEKNCHTDDAYQNPVDKIMLQVQ